MRSTVASARASGRPNRTTPRRPTMVSPMTKATARVQIVAIAAPATPSDGTGPHPTMRMGSSTSVTRDRREPG